MDLCFCFGRKNIEYEKDEIVCEKEYLLIILCPKCKKKYIKRDGVVYKIDDNQYNVCSTECIPTMGDRYTHIDNHIDNE